MVECKLYQKQWRWFGKWHSLSFFALPWHPCTDVLGLQVLAVWVLSLPKAVKKKRGLYSLSSSLTLFFFTSHFVSWLTLSFDFLFILLLHPFTACIPFLVMTTSSLILSPSSLTLRCADIVLFSSIISKASHPRHLSHARQEQWKLPAHHFKPTRKPVFFKSSLSWGSCRSCHQFCLLILSEVCHAIVLLLFLLLDRHLSRVMTKWRQFGF